MTIRMPQKNFLDKILKLFGKERCLKVPDFYRNGMEKGIDIYVQGQFESFWQALFRRSSREDQQKIRDDLTSR
ncbi:MAG: hypothetical protein PHW74_11840 [Desulfobacca sp.]|nr:hypothetical protein [Desulfobacca sp.]